MSVNRIAQACLKIMKIKNASDLGRIAAAVGLAQNLAAVRALATEGIQRGHMSMHARSIALTLGARGEELQHVVRDVVKKGEITTDGVQRALTDLRGPDAGLTRAINKALGYALDTQEASGKWSGLSSPRIFETAIAVVALDKTGEYEEAVQKARLWLRGQAIQDHHQVAQTYEQMAYSLAMERFGAIDLSDPLLFDPVFLRKTETLAALATFAGRSLTSHVPKEKILTGIRELTDTEQKRETIKPWALSDLLAVRVLLGDLEAADPLQALQWEDGSIWNNPVSTAMAFLAFREANRVREAKLAASSLIKTQQDAGYWNYVRLDCLGNLQLHPCLLDRSGVPEQRPAASPGLSPEEPERGRRVGLFCGHRLGQRIHCPGDHRFEAGRAIRRRRRSESPGQEGDPQGPRTPGGRPATRRPLVHLAVRRRCRCSRRARPHHGGDPPVRRG